MQYDEELLQEIEDNVDLLDYVRNYYELTKKGDDYFTNCPLHVDVTPSLSFTPSKNKYYCFSCGKGGGIISFLVNFEHLPFDDAVAKAARIAGKDLSKMCKSETYRFLNNLKRNRSIHSEPVKHEILDESEMNAYEYGRVDEWLDEGIHQDMIDKFGVKIDRWANRIVYPVRDIYGRLINIKGRTRYPNYKQLKLMKYINYRKIGCMDYFQSLDITLPFVNEKGEIIIFESVKSVMKAYQWGYKNCASAEKHTLTEEQIRLLIKLHVDVVLAYDSDISYWSNEVKNNIDLLKRFTNVFIIDDRNGLLGGAESKNSPVDIDLDTWQILYESKRKII